MNTHLAKELWDAEELARKLFLDDPDTSIDDAAREVDRLYRRSLGKDALSRIRRDVRECINAKMGSEGRSAPPAAVQVFVNRPRLAAPRLKVGVEEEKVEKMAKRPMVDSHEKKKWFDDWALANPWSTIKEARAAITTQFGEGLGTDYIAETLKTARHLVVEQRKAPELKSVPETSVVTLQPEKSLNDTVRELASAMKAAGIKSIKRNEDGTVDFESSLSV